MDDFLQSLRDGQWKEELSSPLVQWGGLVCVLIFLWWVGVGPYYEWRAEVKSRIDQQYVRLSRLQVLENSRENIRTETNHLNKQLAVAKAELLKERTQSRAISAQVDRFEDVYKPHGLKLKGRLFGEPDVIPYLGEKVESRWRLLGKTDDILAMLYDLAHAKTLMVPVSVQIKKSTERRRGRKNSENAPDYEISMTLNSYRLLPMKDIKRRK
ncbi:hypothetical protein [Vibrio quintilis]|uniref:Pilus assembly protein, PilO n=1 Tax=Vibrio quintilis TaxID=1117707 RepID=A0A1M7YY19_9VIBR|nr:hypothetical protein [Vibrio quintilis]SHO57579.1 hypothetical protein VQ7734_03349 [Vibrio quintilis]